MTNPMLAELDEVVRLMNSGCRPDEYRCAAANFLRANAHHIANMAKRLEAAERPKDVLAWFADDDTGTSSQTIALHMTGVTPKDPDAPYDPDDLGRCLRLLERFPEWKPRMGEMAQYGRRWAAIVPHWDGLAQMMADEVGIDWSKGRRAQRTYDAMKCIDATTREGVG